MDRSGFVHKGRKFVDKALWVTLFMGWDKQLSTDGAWPHSGRNQAAVASPHVAPTPKWPALQAAKPHFYLLLAFFAIMRGFSQSSRV